jgi:hypothetical protein
VPGAVGAEARAARGAVGGLGADGFEDRAEGHIGLFRTARHDRRAEQRALFAAGDAGADEVQALLAQGGLAAAGVLEVGVASVDDHVAGLHERGELVDDGVRGVPGLDHDHGLAGALEGGDEVLELLGRHEVAFVAVGLDQLGGLGVRAVVDGDGEAVAGEVPCEVGAHDGQPDHADVGGAHTQSPYVAKEVCDPILAGRPGAGGTTADRIHAAGWTGRDTAADCPGRTRVGPRLWACSTTNPSSTSSATPRW